MSDDGCTERIRTGFRFVSVEDFVTRRYVFLRWNFGWICGSCSRNNRITAPLILDVPAPIDSMDAGTNIIVSTASAFTGTLRHLRERRVNLEMISINGVPSFAGALVGRCGSILAPEGLLTMVVRQGVGFVSRSRDIMVAEISVAYKQKMKQVHLELNVS